MKEEKVQQGVTLIALVITIIILIILAGVTINILMNENGIIVQAQKAKEQTQIAKEIEDISSAISKVQIADNYQKITYNNLQVAILEQFGDKAKLLDNGNGTFTVMIEDRAYDILSNGEMINWKKVMENTKAPSSQDEERNKGVIGIGTDGQPVDMDLWEYTFLEEENGYCLNDLITIQDSSNRTAAYRAENIQDGKIIGTVPMYISSDNGKKFAPVINMYCSFLELSQLKEAPIIPNTVIYMESTFQSCTNLMVETVKIPNSVKSLNYTFQSCTFSKGIQIPNSVVKMNGTYSWNTNLIEIPNFPDEVTEITNIFYSCSNLIRIPSIPDTIIQMKGAFYGCSRIELAPKLPNKVKDISLCFAKCISLRQAPEIPSTVENMDQTFLLCESLETPPILIPNSVTNMYRTFYECKNISGTINIQANLSGNTMKNGFPDYYQCFWSAPTEIGKNLTLNCTEKIYNLFYDAGTKNNIKADICYEGLKINLVKK